MDKLEMPLEQFAEAVVKENEHLRTKIERLRSALEPFACTCSVKGMGAGGNCTKGSGECANWNVRAALEETK